ncbi:CDP-alcohol phosphatidyltransferase family protein [Flavobacterium stagni]|uniref:CDP-alcohol phosphatidyltransferase family protein n=1 Tax=Flavobacterium stagni TaxID=2506421 RepID=A0A4Q1KBP7_9FLAO|nr:CDP-alcohol phosphatidyltransferase family protein [Flavobacterium stagni]RXR23909.1 CDP-alcohol phosphatidyltransferase family protein [Flavobacterium stagni]
MKKIPLLLILFRLLLGPIAITLVVWDISHVRPILLVLLSLGFISDILDGIIARKTGVASAKLRRMDSQTDMVFWVCIGVCAWLLNPELIAENRLAVFTVLAMEALTYVYSFLKFGRETCTHAFLSKLWGITLLVVFVSLIGFAHAGVPFALAIIFGVISHLDVYLIILILPKWTHDVPSAYHAYLIRKGIPFKKHSLLN